MNTIAISEPPKVYPSLIEEIEEWPIHKQSEDRTAFVEELIDHTYVLFKQKDADELKDILLNTVFKENHRIKTEPWKVDGPKDKPFWLKMQKAVQQLSPELPEEERKMFYLKKIHQIIDRYSEEIVGTFKKKTFLFARKFLTILFNRLLNAAANKKFDRLVGRRVRLYDRLKAYGPIEQIRALDEKGTIVVIPTHYSNIDSIIIGYALDGILGLPAFTFGAGLNLYNFGPAAYFINRLGAYRLDRRKKNPIYLKNLYQMSKLTLMRETNMIFFPGGTRSRSGGMEERLKLGMMGTVLDAQEALHQKGSDHKIYVVPLVMSYNFVLEAKYLIDNYLRKSGKEQYFKGRDMSYSFRKTTKFIWDLFSNSSDIILSFGKPIDVFGNEVDSDGQSWKNGVKVNLGDYFVAHDNSKGTRTQRNNEYTRNLAKKILEKFKSDNIILPSHFVAFALFSLLRSKFKEQDLYELFRIPTEAFEVKPKEFESHCQKILTQLAVMSEKGELKLADYFTRSLSEIIEEGIKSLGIYHAKKVVKFNKEGNIVSDDFGLLYYYHNRMNAYNIKL